MSEHPITREQVEAFVTRRYGARHVQQRIEDRGFAFYVNLQPEAYMDSGQPEDMDVGGGPLAIIKHSGQMLYCSSNPGDMFGLRASGVGVCTAQTLEEFTEALQEHLDAGSQITS